MNGSFCVNEKRDCNKEDEVKTSKFVILQIVIRRREINAWPYREIPESADHIHKIWKPRKKQIDTQFERIQ